LPVRLPSQRCPRSSPLAGVLASTSLCAAGRSCSRGSEPLRAALSWVHEPLLRTLSFLRDCADICRGVAHIGKVPLPNLSPHFIKLPISQAETEFRSCFQLKDVGRLALCICRTAVPTQPYIRSVAARGVLGTAKSLCAGSKSRHSLYSTTASL
jgi:hypothetical protein